MAGTRRKPSAKRAVLILAAYPRLGLAERAARSLVRERVLACATVSAARAFYVWGGRERSELSATLHGKTTAARAAEAVRLIRESHPDKVPEILVIEIAAGDRDYLAWVAEQVKPR
ncbi:MAG TPA: divalent cation tolerance protein CutA [Candidatus Limnocylindrales bacterium]|nr:divalent cation tolerance protein CutA [Candidatus Limnocylindrales bacterium]